MQRKKRIVGEGEIWAYVAKRESIKHIVGWRTTHFAFVKSSKQHTIKIRIHNVINPRICLLFFSPQRHELPKKGLTKKGALLLHLLHLPHTILLPVAARGGCPTR